MVGCALLLPRGADGAHIIGVVRRWIWSFKTQGVAAKLKVLLGLWTGCVKFSQLFTLSHESEAVSVDSPTVVKDRGRWVGWGAKAGGGGGCR
eukprot:SAG25_NODE_259_length_10888_cov_14.204468_7_plen_92_part_00